MNRPMNRAKLEQISATVRHLPNICDLPEELLVHISSYLSFYDRKLSRLVCKRWNEVSYSHCLIKNDWLVVPSVSSLKTLQQMPEYLKFVNLRISSVGNTYEETTFWLRFGSKIKKVELIDASMTNPVIVDVLKSCTDLRSFALIGCEKRDFVAKSFVKSAPFMLPKLKCLKLIKVDDLLDEEFKVLTENAANLTEIHLHRYVEDSEGIELEFSDEEYEFGGLFGREIYSEDDDETGSESFIENDYDSGSVVENESRSSDESEKGDLMQNESCSNDVKEEGDLMKKESCSNDVNEEDDLMQNESCSNDVKEEGDLMQNESCSNDVNEEDDLMQNESCSNDVNEEDDLMQNESCSNDVKEEGDLMKKESCSNDVNEKGDLMQNESCSNDVKEEGDLMNNKSCTNDVNEEGDEMKNKFRSSNDVNEEVDQTKNDLCFNGVHEKVNPIKKKSYSDDVNEESTLTKNESSTNDVNEESNEMMKKSCLNDVNDDFDLTKDKSCSNDVNEESDLMKNESCSNDEKEDGDLVKSEPYSDDESNDCDRMEYESIYNYELGLLKVSSIVDLVKRQSSQLTHLALSETDFPGNETLIELISSLGKQLKYLKIKLPKDTPLQKKSIKALSENCPNLESIDLTFSTIEKDDFTTLFSSLPKVRKVRMLGVRTVIGNALQVMSNLEFLSEIDLSFWDINNAFVMNLGNRLMPNIRVLIMNETWVHDDVILKISPLVPNITDWSLNYTYLGDIGLKAIVKNNKLLRFLSVIGCVNLTNVIPHINELTEMRILDLSDCKGIPITSFACLNLRYLQELLVNGLAKPVYDDLKTIIGACPSLEHLYVDGIPDLKIIRPTIHCNGER